MENSIRKLRAAALLASAITRELGEKAVDFSVRCDGYVDPAVSLITAYEALDFREKVMIGMRLGFDYPHDYQPIKPHKYIDLATAFELTAPESASKICRKAYHKIARMVMESPDYCTGLQIGKENAR